MYHAAGHMSASASKVSPPGGRLGTPGSGRRPSARLQAQAKRSLEVDASLSPGSRQGTYSKDDYVYETSSPVKRRRNPTVSPSALSAEPQEESPSFTKECKKRRKGKEQVASPAAPSAAEEGEKENMHASMRSTNSPSPKTGASPRGRLITSVPAGPTSTAQCPSPNPAAPAASPFLGAAAPLPPAASADTGLGAGEDGVTGQSGPSLAQGVRPSDFALFDPNNGLGPGWHSMLLGTNAAYGAYLNASLGSLMPLIGLVNSSHQSGQLSAAPASSGTAPPVSAAHVRGSSDKSSALPVRAAGGGKTTNAGAGKKDASAASFKTAHAAPAASAGTDAGKVKMTAEERNKQKLKRQQEVMHAIGSGNVTEKSILDRVGDSRYTREILRRLLAQGVVIRVGKGGSNDPFLYTIVAGMVSEDGNIIASSSLVDPGLEVRLKRIETKILGLLSTSNEFTTEKYIRTQVGDNTGTGKALRRLVVSGRVLREGKGGVGDPFRYRYCSDCPTAPLTAAAPNGPAAAWPIAAAAAAAAAAARASAARSASAKGGKKGACKFPDDKDRARAQRKRSTPSDVSEERAKALPLGAAGAPCSGLDAGAIDFTAEAAPFAALMHPDDGHDHQPCPTSSEAPSNSMSAAVEEDPRNQHGVVAVAPFTPKWARKYRSTTGGADLLSQRASKSPTSPSLKDDGKIDGKASSTGSRGSSAGGCIGRVVPHASVSMPRRVAPVSVCIDDSLDADPTDSARCPHAQTHASLEHRPHTPYSQHFALLLSTLPVTRGFSALGTRRQALKIIAISIPMAATPPHMTTVTVGRVRHSLAPPPTLSIPPPSLPAATTAPQLPPPRRSTSSSRMPPRAAPPPTRASRGSVIGCPLLICGSFPSNPFLPCPSVSPVPTPPLLLDAHEELSWVLMFSACRRSLFGSQ